MEPEFVSESDNYSSSSEQKSKKKSVRTRKYIQKYVTQWETDFKWCQQSANSQFAFCKVCNKEIKGNRTHLERHEEHALHKKNLETKSNIMSIDNI